MISAVMLRNRRQRLFAVWLALCGVAFQALWPLAATAGSDSLLTLQEVCTASGARLVFPGGDTPAAPDVQHRLSHCALCTTAAGGIAPPSAVPVGFTPTPGLCHVKPASQAVNPGEIAFFQPGAARAPPVFS